VAPKLRWRMSLPSSTMEIMISENKEKDKQRRKSGSGRTQVTQKDYILLDYTTCLITK